MKREEWGGESCFDEVEPEESHIKRQWVHANEDLVIWLEELPVTTYRTRLLEFSHKDLMRVCDNLDTDMVGPGGLEKIFVDLCNQALDVMQKGGRPVVEFHKGGD